MVAMKTRSEQATSQAGDDVTATQARRRSYLRRRMTIYLARTAVVVVVVGGWQLGVKTKVIDPFFWGEPSGVVSAIAHLG